MKKLVRLVAVLGVLFTLIVGFMYSYIEWSGRHAEPERSDIIILLGAAVWPNGPSPALLERIFLAETLYRQGYAPAIITTGGIGNFNPTPEGAAARQTLISRGVAAAVVYEEVRSRNTRENLVEARKIMLQHGWQSAIIVTHDYHLPRALAAARRLGIDASGAGVRETAMFRPPLVLREVAAHAVKFLNPMPEGPLPQEKDSSLK
jgi:uncharacterized SAM-binding protein YcdF (DUF218 family)